MLVLRDIIKRGTKICFTCPLNPLNPSFKGNRGLFHLPLRPITKVCFTCPLDPSFNFCRYCFAIAFEKAIVLPKLFQKLLFCRSFKLVSFASLTRRKLHRRFGLIHCSIVGKISPDIHESPSPTLIQLRNPLSSPI